MSFPAEPPLRGSGGLSRRSNFQPIILQNSGVSHVLESLFRHNYDGAGCSSQEEIDEFE